MTNRSSCDVLIVGSGIIGLSIGVATLEAKPNARILVIEKEKRPGLHASGRNSGVIHAGFYYSPESLKAKLCGDGNIALKTLAKKYEIPILNCGKIIVAQTEDENGSLDSLMARGEANKVDLEIHPEKNLNKFEPLAITKERFIWSPGTSVADPIELLNALRNEFERLGGKINFETEVSLKLLQGEVVTKSNQFDFKLLINASGAHSLKHANEVGVGMNYLNMPFLGMYRTTSYSELPLSKLVYPVPHPVNPFLGIHFTITNNKMVKIGPSAIPILGIEQYQLLGKVSFNEVKSSASAFFSLLTGSRHKISDLYVKEFLNLIPSVLVKRASRIVPGALDIKDWKPYKSGIRGQLINKVNGELAQDFLIEEKLNSIHVLNAVSPGWTSAIPFGKYIAEKYVLNKIS
jgi:L-2-hydroxyglutarate oxidase